MASEEVKKRKACDPCTKAKAKCSPSGSRADICGRCERLNKECVYGDSLRKRGPRTRSRMKQLEQRVETLMGMLSASDSASDATVNGHSSAHVTGSRPNNMGAAQLGASPKIDITPEDSLDRTLVEAFAVYDPVDVGLIKQDDAIMLLDEFRRDYAQYFPFVVLDASIDMHTFRCQKPFLFLSIMAAMTYRTPSTQRILAENFRDQVAVHIMGCNLKGLEMLQGLLVHSAYYHFFYRPGKQQLALMIQLCVATAQELGLTAKCKGRDMSNVAPVLSTAESRAMLGTYYLAAAFAQAWRKRTTMPYTRALARACQSFQQRPECPTDLLISPLVQLSELMCRINDYFSYDNIEESELKGDTILDLSTNNFSTEYQRMRDGMSDSVAQNVSMRLVGDILDVMIYECSLHSTLWQASPSTSSTTMSQSRMRMLQNSLKASQNLARTLISVPFTSLNHLIFPIWSGWFYSALSVMKMVVLRQNGYTASFRMQNLPHTVGELLPQGIGASTTQRVGKMTSLLVQTGPRQGDATAEESELVALFQSFTQKLEAATLDSHEAGSVFVINPFLTKVAKLQEGLLSGIKKMTEHQNPASEVPVLAQYPSAHENDSGISTSYEVDATDNSFQSQQVFTDQHQDPHFKAMQYDEPLNFSYSGDPQTFDYQFEQPPAVEDWLWNMMMSDGNMFTF